MTEEDKKYSIVSIGLVTLMLIQILFDLTFFVLLNYRTWTIGIFILFMICLIFVLVIWIYIVILRFSKMYNDIESRQFIDFISGIGFFIIDILMTLYSPFSFGLIYTVLFLIMYYRINHSKKGRMPKNVLIFVLLGFVGVLVYHFILLLNPDITYYITN